MDIHEHVRVESAVGGVSGLQCFVELRRQGLPFMSRRLSRPMSRMFISSPWPCPRGMSERWMPKPRRATCHTAYPAMTRTTATTAPMTVRANRRPRDRRGGGEPGRRLHPRPRRLDPLLRNRCWNPFAQARCAGIRCCGTRRGGPSPGLRGWADRAGREVGSPAVSRNALSASAKPRRRVSKRCTTAAADGVLRFGP